MRLEELGRSEPLRTWNATHWFYDVVSFANGRRLLATTKTDHRGKAEVLVLSPDDVEPLLRIPAESDFLRARLLPDESGILVQHKEYTGYPGGPAFARLHYFDPQRPTVTIDDFRPGDLDSVDFDRECRFIAGSSKFRQAWLWSAETGKLLHAFHRRGQQQTGFDDVDIRSVRLDPDARFAVTRSGRQSSRSHHGSSLKVWSLKDFQPIDVYDMPRHIGRVIQVRDDGTFVISRYDELWLLSFSGHQAPLRRLKTGSLASVRPIQCIHETGRIYAVNQRAEMFQWQLATWTAEDLQRQLERLEQRTARKLDPATGRIVVVVQP